MTKTNITAHMIVKNEDQWVYFAINSVLPYVDHFLITDTGSTDNTLKIIRSIKSPKIKLTQTEAGTQKLVTALRQDQLNKTTTSWVWIVDADEIYPQKTAQECLDFTKQGEVEGVVVRRYDLLGDVYHKQIESVGEYRLFGYAGHLLVRLINRDFLKGLHYEGNYPNEGFYTGEGQSILGRDKSQWRFTTHHLYHAMYLKRSSLGGNLNMFNRNKYKLETGITIKDSLPEIFYLPLPSIIPNPFTKRGIIYEILASIISPLKRIKRKVL